jgi:TolB protein
LLALIGLLSACILAGAVGLGALAVLRLGQADGLGLPLSQAGAGQLLVVGADQRLLTVDERGRERVLVEDASPDLFRYPSLSPDGERIAYISQDDEGFALRSMDVRGGGQTELYRSTDDPPLYVAWSPDGENISFLSNRSAGGLAVYVVPADGSREADLLGTAASSSYFAWQPDGGRLLLHIGGSSFEDGRVAAFEPGSTAPLYELADPGFFQAPAWTADGSGFFYVAQPPVQGQPSPELIESVLTRVSADGTGPQELAREKLAAMLFLRAPQSDHIAYITVGRGGFGPLKLVDPGGADRRTLSRPDEQVSAFFWSPDGAQLAYLTRDPGPPGEAPLFTWHIVERASGERRDLESFAPSQAFVAMVNFFDAYAISFDLWSSDGRELVYAASDGVYVLDVSSGEARRRSDGVLGMWAGPR